MGGGGAYHLPSGQGLRRRGGSSRLDASFLEDKLAVLGLSEREATEFITLWGPRIAERGRALVTFATDEYARKAVYRFTAPSSGAEIVPEAFIRVYISSSGMYRKYRFLSRSLCLHPYGPDSPPSSGAEPSGRAGKRTQQLLRREVVRVGPRTPMMVAETATMKAMRTP